MKTVDFSETIAACDLKVGRCRQLIELMKVCDYSDYRKRWRDVIRQHPGPSHGYNSIISNAK